MKRNRIDGLVKGTKPLLGVSVAPGGRGAKGARRCAIYCRKSSERGLEQEFNSLDAQRESGEAYVRAMTAEGWVCLPDRYDAPPARRVQRRQRGPARAQAASRGR